MGGWREGGVDGNKKEGWERWLVGCKDVWVDEGMEGRRETRIDK